jgi:hypothetical protein
LRQISVENFSSTTHKKAKGKPPIRTQPPRTKDTPSATAFHIANTKPRTTNQLVVETGATLVILRRQHIDLLTNVQISGSGQLTFAILRAANGRILNSIGRGMLSIRTNTIDLIHNLLGISPFANLGCTAVFTATQFRLYHHKILILYSANLWQIALNLSNVTLTPAPVLQQYDDSALPVLLMHDNTRLNEDYVRYIHSCLGRPLPFYKQVQRGYITCPNQFPRLTTTMVRRNMPDSEAISIKHRLGNHTLLHNPSMLSDDSIGTYDEQNQLRQNHFIPHPSRDRKHYTSTIPDVYLNGAKL